MVNFWRKICHSLPLLALIFLSLSSLSASSGPKATFVTLNKRLYVSAENIARIYGFKVTQDSKSCKLATSLTTMTFNANKRYAGINGTIVTLDFPVVYYNKKYYISRSDYYNLIVPVLSKAYLKGTRPKVIVIDPGHGGSDCGAVGTRHKEHTLTLAIAKKLQAQLTKRGFKVYLTRSGNTTKTLDERSAYANRVGADLFISIHLNASTNKSISGIETYTITPVGAPSSSSNEPSNKVYPGNTMDGNSAALAYQIQKELRLATKAKDRGLKKARFKVLTQTKCPSVLVECGFISNGADEAKLASSAYQDLLASSIAKAISTYSARLPLKR